MPDIQEVEEGTVKKARRFDQRDWSTVADFIKSEFDKRKDRRKDLEKAWDEIDRQVAMKPDTRFKCDASGQVKKGSEWMPEIEMPDQAQALEVNTADARRFMFPDAGPWFQAHSALTDEYLARVDFQSLVAGDEAEVPTKVNQDNADKLVEGLLEHYHRQYDFRGTWDRLHAEATKYGIMVARARQATKSIFIDTAKGTIKRDQKIPILFAQSIRNTYLDDSAHHLMHEGMIVGPSFIRCFHQKLVDLQVAANKGSSDPDSMTGGWMPENVKKLEPNDRGEVECLEYEGDLVVPRKTVRSVFVPNCIVTVAVGKNGPKVVRFRFNKLTFGSYLTQTYHVEGAEDFHGTCPLRKGLPVQLLMTEAASRLAQWAVLNVEPPIKYSKDDPFFAQSGGPIVAPRELWATMGEVDPVKIGDGGALLSLFAAMQTKYADLTGTQAPRLGAQTISHTTAFAKNAELSRGMVRTVDYVNSCLTGIAPRWLSMEYEMARNSIKGTEAFYIPAYKGWVEIEKKHLPDLVEFEAFGAGGPAEEREKKASMLAGLQMAMQIDAMKIQLRMGQPMDYDAVQREVLTQAGWSDVDIFFARASAGVPVANQVGPQVPAVDAGLGGTANTAVESVLG